MMHLYIEMMTIISKTKSGRDPTGEEVVRFPLVVWLTLIVSSVPMSIYAIIACPDNCQLAR